jgi:hypothetical protein
MTDATPSNRAIVAALTSAIESANAKGGAWLTSRLDDGPRGGAQHGGSVSSDLATAFSWAVRKVGEARLDIVVSGLPTPEPGWDSATCARLALLLHFADSHAAAEQQRLLSTLFYRGDTAEKCAVLRCLPLLSEPERYLLVATDSVRSHVQPVLEAIACENPFPARHFDDVAFNQLVMKAYFTGVPASRIFGLHDRKNAELSRMATDFASERRAAGRPVPTDLSMVIASS